MLKHIYVAAGVIERVGAGQSRKLRKGDAIGLNQIHGSRTYYDLELEVPGGIPAAVADISDSVYIRDESHLRAFTQGLKIGLRFGGVVLVEPRKREYRSAS